MRYSILQNHETKGPYTIGQLRSMWNSGAITGDTLYCEEDSDQWETMERLATELDQPQGPPPLNVPLVAPPAFPQEASQPAERRGDATAKSADNLIYQDTAFRITTAVVMVDGTTYALRNINSVKVVKTGVGCSGIALAAFGVLAGMGFMASGGTAAVAVGLLTIAVIGYCTYVASRRCVLSFDTSSGAVTGFESKDWAYLQRMAGKIGEAIARRQ
jgi:hypothetical protein